MVAMQGKYAGCRILVVDDDPMNCELVRLRLESPGFIIDSAHDGGVAVAKVRAHRYDLIMMDIQMPVMDGLEATRLVRQLPNGATVAILASTASQGQEQRQNCMDAGMTGFITKPFTGAALLDAVIRWVNPP